MIQGIGNTNYYNSTPSIPHDNTWMQYPGEGIGTIVGGIYGNPYGGYIAGQNAGATAGDLFGGNTTGLGYDVSSNLAPGMQAKGWGGLANGATGLPVDLTGIFGDDRKGVPQGGILPKMMGSFMNFL